MATERLKIIIDDEELDKSVAKMQTALETETEIKGLDMAVNRIISQLPGLREARGLTVQIQTLLRINPAIAALLVAVQVLRWLIGERERRVEQEKAYEMLIREYRGFTHEQYTVYQRKVDESYRSDTP